VNFLRRSKNAWALLFQGIIAFFILFSTYSTPGPQSGKSHTKVLLCVSPGSTVVVREASVQSTPVLSFFQKDLLQEIWFHAEGFYTAALLTNAALKVSSGIYNSFYLLPTIHAP
jgi:hypothetical protein